MQWESIPIQPGLLYEVALCINRLEHVKYPSTRTKVHQSCTAFNMFRSTLLLAALAQCVVSTFVLLPLYVYPSSDAWNSVYTAVAQSPQVQWQIVVNPNSGPGAANSYPDSVYAAAIGKLNSYANVVTLGYVRTNYTNRALADVKVDVDTYAHWNTYAAANISVAGVFFDEATSSPASDAIQYMQDAAAEVRAQFPSAQAQVIFNPGTKDTPAAYFDYADTIVEFENAYSAYQDQATIDSFPSAYRSQSAIIAHDTTASQSELNSRVSNIFANDIAGLYFTNDCCYNALGYLPTLTAAVAAA